MSSHVDDLQQMQFSLWGKSTWWWANTEQMGNYRPSNKEEKYQLTRSGDMNEDRSQSG